MKNVVRSIAGGAASVQITDITFNHLEPSMPLERSAKNIVDVVAVTRREVVDSDNGLTERQQILKKIGSDESSDAGHDPDFGRGDQRFAEAVVDCGNHDLGGRKYPQDRIWTCMRGT